SRKGNQSGSIFDGDPDGFVVTYDGTAASEDWFAVTLPTRVTIRRIVFMHGQNFHDGGWFDTRKGKPRVQIQPEKGGPSKSWGPLRRAPDATARRGKGLSPGEALGLRLDRPAEAGAVGAVGFPASGDNSAQAFSSCAELQAFGD